jgi:hypothetical protein
MKLSTAPTQSTNQSTKEIKIMAIMEWIHWLKTKSLRGRLSFWKRLGVGSPTKASWEPYNSLIAMYGGHAGWIRWDSTAQQWEEDGEEYFEEEG